MSAQNEGRDTIFAFKNGLGAALSKACRGDSYEDAVHLARAAEIVRQDIFTMIEFCLLVGVQFVVFGYSH